MTITPDQADQWAQRATDGPWSIDPDYGTVEPDVISGEGCRFEASDEDLALIAAAPDLAQTIAGMTEVWGVEEQADDGGWWRITTWHMNLKDLDAFHDRPGHRLVRRLLGPVEVIDGE